jgi:hypothetical protein
MIIHNFHKKNLRKIRRKTKIKKKSQRKKTIQNLKARKLSKMKSLKIQLVQDLTEKLLKLKTTRHLLPFPKTNTF